MNPDHLVAAALILGGALWLAGGLLVARFCGTNTRTETHDARVAALCESYAAAARGEGQRVVDDFDDVEDPDAAVAQVGVDVEIYNLTGGLS